MSDTEIDLASALEIVLGLAEGNALDNSDPEVRMSVPLAEAALAQKEALRIMHQWLEAIQQGKIVVKVTP